MRARFLALLSPELWASILAWWFDRKEETREQDAEKVSSCRYLVCLVSLVFWLNETNQMNQTNQMDQTERARIGSGDTSVQLVVGGRLRVQG